jgi:hypothetical protein
VLQIFVELVEDLAVYRNKSVRLHKTLQCIVSSR